MTCEATAVIAFATVPADPAHATQDAQVRTNLSVWTRGNFLKHYRGRALSPAESEILTRHREHFKGDVLELGCGAGRVTGHLIGLEGSVQGIDVSPAMVAYCREAYPGGAFSVRDLRDLSDFEAESLDAVVAVANVLDVLDDSERRRVLREIKRVLRPGGLLWMSSHNRTFIPNLRKPTEVRARSFIRTVGKLVLMPWRVRNHRRLARFQRFERDYAVVNDDAHHFRLLHYYISHDAQERQLGEEGFELVECVEREGHTLLPGEDAPDCAELHYVARRPPAHAD
jgi:SAM-dependent methyltransferase